MAEKTPTVWVTQENPRFDYTPARQFGVLRYITHGDYSNDENSVYNSYLSEEIMAEIKEFDSDTDYILPSGSPVVMMAVSAILGRAVRRLKVLKWDNRSMRYNSLIVEV